MKNWKGIILAGGKGTRQYPITKGVSKQLLPVYDKPLIYYPLSVLMLCGIRDILIITTKNDLNSYKNLLGNGENTGLNISYEIQDEPKGLAEAFIIGEEFIGNDNVCLILGDNIFYGQGFKDLLIKAKNNSCGATIFGYKVNNPSEFGIIEFDNDMNVLSVEEKPKNPKSNYAATGIYFYDNSVVSKAKNVQKSKRGELEITSIITDYLNEDNLQVLIFGRGFAWLDTGNCDSLLQASQFVHAVETRQGLKIACIEEISYRNKWIDDEILKINIDIHKNSKYGSYLKYILNSEE